MCAQGARNKKGRYSSRYSHPSCSIVTEEVFQVGQRLYDSLVHCLEILGEHFERSLQVLVQDAGLPRCRIVWGFVEELNHRQQDVLELKHSDGSIQS